jgi:hypothetical protein
MTQVSEIKYRACLRSPTISGNVLMFSIDPEKPVGGLGGGEEAS